ncbi:hypothetical protein ACFL5O_05270 [Myxococcota bacterium]
MLEARLVAAALDGLQRDRTEMGGWASLAASLALAGLEDGRVDEARDEIGGSESALGAPGSAELPLELSPGPAGPERRTRGPTPASGAAASGRGGLGLEEGDPEKTGGVELALRLCAAAMLAGVAATVGERDETVGLETDVPFVPRESTGPETGPFGGTADTGFATDSTLIDVPVGLPVAALHGPAPPAERGTAVESGDVSASSPQSESIASVSALGAAVTPMASRARSFVLYRVIEQIRHTVYDSGGGCALAV